MLDKALAGYLKYLRHCKNRQVKDWQLIEDYTADERMQRDAHLYELDDALPFRGKGFSQIDDDKPLQEIQAKVLLVLKDHFTNQFPTLDGLIDVFKAFVQLRDELAMTESEPGAAIHLRQEFFDVTDILIDQYARACLARMHVDLEALKGRLLQYLAPADEAPSGELLACYFPKLYRRLGV